VTRAANSRDTACRILAAWMRTGTFADRLIGERTGDRAFVVETVYGAIRWKRLLEWAVASFTGASPPPPVLPYLHIGLYQLLKMDNVPAHAAVNETVEAAKRRLGARRAGLVNAVLRKAAGERGPVLERIAALPLDVRESHPPLLVARWIAGFGEAGAARLCAHNNRRPSVVIRPNLLRTGFAEYMQRLHAAGTEAEPHPWAPDRCIVVPHGNRVESLPGYSEGLFSVQDPATLAAVDLLDPRPGESVLDACAAPGGKTAAIAERMRCAGRIVAADVGEPRLLILRSNLSRLGLDAVRVCRCNAGRPGEVAALCGEGRFDRILVDAPCTNTGVLARRPDARWRFSRESLKECRALQAGMLDALAGGLKPGGVLVYSTCSLEPEENEGLAAWWSERHPDFKPAGSVSLFPPDTLTDGAFAAAWRAPGVARE